MLIIEPRQIFILKIAVVNAAVEILAAVITYNIIFMEFLQCTWIFVKTGENKYILLAEVFPRMCPP